MGTTKKQVMIRFQPNVYAKLKSIADSDKRSVTNLVEYLIERYIESYEKQNGQLSLFNVQQGENIVFQSSVSGV